MEKQHVCLMDVTEDYQLMRMEIFRLTVLTLHRILDSKCQQTNRYSLRLSEHSK